MTSCFDVRHYCFNVTRSLNLVTLRLGVKKLPHKSSRFAAFHVAREEPRGVYLPKGGVFRVIDDISLVLNVRRLRISQFHLRTTPPPPRASAGHLPALSVPGVRHWQILHCPGAGHLPTPGPFPSFWHARGFLSEYNYTEGFTAKKAEWLICQGQE